MAYFLATLDNIPSTVMPYPSFHHCALVQVLALSQPSLKHIFLHFPPPKWGAGTSPSPPKVHLVMGVGVQCSVSET